MKPTETIINTANTNFHMTSYQSDDGYSELKIKFSYDLWLKMFKEHAIELAKIIKQETAKEILDKLKEGTEYTPNSRLFIDDTLPKLRKEYGVK